MERRQRFRTLKPHLTRYVHGNAMRYKPVFGELLRQERLALRFLLNLKNSIREKPPVSWANGSESGEKSRLPHNSG